MLKSLIKVIFTFLFFLIGKLPTRKKTIVFESFLGKQYSDNPKAIYLYIKNNLPDYRLYWSIDRRRVHYFKAEDAHLLPRFSLKWFYMMARAEYWVSNSRLPLWIPKPKGTTYVQTWHGTPLKRLAADIDKANMEKYKADFLAEARRWDYLLSPNAYSTEIFRRAFQFQGTVIESGYPRNDILLHNDDEKTIKRFKITANLPLDKRIILYAPTWRDQSRYDIALDFDRMKKDLKDRYIIVLRLHYLVAESIDVGEHWNFVYDFSDYPDIGELYLMADVLITDYSSVFFDFANVRRPMIFYVYDIEAYRDNLRGFYFDFKNYAPGPLVKTTEQLIGVLMKMETDNFRVDQTFYQKYCYLEDGNASERVVKTIFN